jgi:hypothetical protein
MPNIAGKTAQTDHNSPLANSLAITSYRSIALVTRISTLFVCCWLFLVSLFTDHFDGGTGVPVKRHSSPSPISRRPSRHEISPHTLSLNGVLRFWQGALQRGCRISTWLYCVLIPFVLFPPQSGQGQERCDIRHRAAAGLIERYVLTPLHLNTASFSHFNTWLRTER